MFHHLHLRTKKGCTNTLTPKTAFYLRNLIAYMKKQRSKYRDLGLEKGAVDGG